MEREILDRIAALLAKGDSLLSQRVFVEDDRQEYWVSDRLIPEAQAWMGSTANLIRLITASSSYFADELERLASHVELKSGVPWSVLLKLRGLLASVQDEAMHGLLKKIEYIVVATAFDDFLDHAETFHKANMAREAGVLAAVVLEDVIKRIAEKNGVSPSGQSLEPLVDVLVKAQVFTPVKAKRIKAYVGVRNPALHAEWDKFDIRDAGDLITGTRDLIEHYL